MCVPYAPYAPLCLHYRRLCGGCDAHTFALQLFFVTPRERWRSPSWSLTQCVRTKLSGIFGLSAGKVLSIQDGCLEAHWPSLAFTPCSLLPVLYESGLLYVVFVKKIDT